MSLLAPAWAQSGGGGGQGGNPPPGGGGGQGSPDQFKFTGTLLELGGMSLSVDGTDVTGRRSTRTFVVDKNTYVEKDLRRGDKVSVEFSTTMQQGIYRAVKVLKYREQTRPQGPPRQPGQGQSPPPGGQPGQGSQKTGPQGQWLDVPGLTWR
jgi:hypothetical protein